MISKHTSSVAVALMAIFLAVVFASEDSQPVAETRYGKLLGTVSNVDYSPTPVYSFHGIPYAKPPVGDLRLALAEPVEPWEGDRDATQPGSMCPQKIEGALEVFKPVSWPTPPLSEDCLYLDVYTPSVKGKRDVLVFIHGGGFNMGCGSGVNSTAVAAVGDIVVVAINYRLGVLGFLPNYAGDWPSNLGIRDQQLALRWVKDNIAAFGGNPDSVTISGESAGALSVAGHILSSSSEGLFHRAIMQSGSAFTFGSAAETSAKKGAESVLKDLGCDDLDRGATLVCLRNKTIEEIMQLPPVPQQMDEEFFFSDPLPRITDGNLAKVDLLIGVTSDEGFIVLPYITPELFTSEEPDKEKVAEQLKAYLAMAHAEHSEEVEELVMSRYFEEGLSNMETDQITQNVAKVVGTRILVAPTYLQALYHSDYSANTYFYEFDYQGSYLSDYRPSWHNKCDHGFDLMFTHGGVFMKEYFLVEGTKVSKEDVTMTEIALKYWSNFVKTGNPNGEGLVEWKPFTRQQEDYLILKPQCEPASGFYPEEMEFWNTKIRDVELLDVSVEDESTTDREEL